MNQKLGRMLWAACSILIVIAAVWGLLVVVGGVLNPQVSAFDARPLLLCISLSGFAVVSYLAWPSRWNIVAHTQLAFSIVAYVIPILLLDGLSNVSGAALDLYAQVIVLGFVACTLGVAIGGWVGRLGDWSRVLDRISFATFSGLGNMSKRTQIIVALSILGMVASFTVMGFIPALAADPYAAKFFRGEYAVRYGPVAPLYRLATSAISLLFPLVAMYAWKYRSAKWYMILVGSLGAMLLSLQREPALSGILLFAGILVATRGRGMWIYFLGILGVYFVGSALYYLLSLWGVDSFANGSYASTSFLAEIAAGSPDVADQINFFTKWLDRPEYTDGLTFVGGLIPGNFKWNPSVWSLSVINPGVDVSAISSGGLRLPAPIWGFVSFGWPGVVAVSFGYGFFTGVLAGFARRLIPSTNLAQATVLTVIYVSLSDVIPVFFRLSYLSILQVLVAVILVYWHTSGIRSIEGGSREGLRQDDLRAFPSIR